VQHLRRNLIVAVVLGVVVYAALAVWADVRSLGEELAAFRWSAFAAALGLAFANYLVRFVKWEIYLRQLAIRIPRGESFGLFLAGFVMSVTPAKVGEVLKSFLIKERHGIPVATTAPIVLAERLTDLIALIALAAAGSLAFGHGAWVLAGGAAAVAGVAVVVGVRPVSERVARSAARLPLLRRRADAVLELFRSARVLCRIGNLPIPVLISAAGWFCECLAMYLVVNAFPGVSMDLGTAVFVYSFASVAGALAMMPGGLGVTEGGLAGLTRILVPTARAGAVSAAVILIRLATLWFAVAVGLVALVALGRRPPAARPPDVQSA
jgi:uncharacterized protein (TIRG00374 family)